MLLTVADTLRPRASYCTFEVDDEAVNLTFGFLADISVNTEQIVKLLEGDDTEQEARFQQARAYIARKEEELRQRRQRDAATRRD